MLACTRNLEDRGNIARDYILSYVLDLLNYDILHLSFLYHENCATFTVIPQLPRYNFSQNKYAHTPTRNVSPTNLQIFLNFHGVSRVLGNGAKAIGCFSPEILPPRIILCTSIFSTISRGFVIRNRSRLPLSETCCTKYIAVLVSRLKLRNRACSMTTDDYRESKETFLNPEKLSKKIQELGSRRARKHVEIERSFWQQRRTVGRKFCPNILYEGGRDGTQWTGQWPRFKETLSQDPTAKETTFFCQPRAGWRYMVDFLYGISRRFSWISV